MHFNSLCRGNFCYRCCCCCCYIEILAAVAVAIDVPMWFAAAGATADDMRHLVSSCSPFAAQKVRREEGSAPQPALRCTALRCTALHCAAVHNLLRVDVTRSSVRWTITCARCTAVRGGGSGPQRGGRGEGAGHIASEETASAVHQAFEWQLDPCPLNTLQPLPVCLPPYAVASSPASFLPLILPWQEKREASIRVAHDAAIFGPTARPAGRSSSRLKHSDRSQHSDGLRRSDGLHERCDWQAKGRADGSGGSSGAGQPAGAAAEGPARTAAGLQGNGESRAANGMTGGKAQKGVVTGGVRGLISGSDGGEEEEEDMPVIVEDAGVMVADREDEPAVNAQPVSPCCKVFKTLQSIHHSNVHSVCRWQVRGKIG